MVYRVDFGDAKRGQHKRGRRYAVVIGPGLMPWSVVTAVPTCRQAPTGGFPDQSWKSAGTKTRLLVDQIPDDRHQFMCTAIRSTIWDRDQMAKVEHAGTIPWPRWPSHPYATDLALRVELPGIEPPGPTASLKASPCAARHASVGISRSRR